MPNLGDIDVQSLAGALSTGTHGTGARLPNLSAQVEAIELVLADGSERTLDGGDALRAARVGLGALGVIAAVTLRCLPAFRLRGVDRPEPLADVLADLDARADAHDHFEFWTFPHSDLALTRSNDRTEAPPHRPSAAHAYLSDVLLDNRAFHAVNLLARLQPRAIPHLNRFASAVASRRERVDWSYAVFSSKRLVRFEEMEYALPRAAAAEAVRTAREILERHPVSFPVELRFSAGDDALLSPAHGRDSAFVAVHLFEGFDYAPAFREVEAAMSALGGRPHWGKRSFLSAADLAPRYPRWADFQAVRGELDPHGRFVSPWVRHVLGG
jgi:L-gulonolactone oxidase